MDTDLVVIGAGALGLSTALHAALAGQSVVVVDRDAFLMTEARQSRSWGVDVQDAGPGRLLPRRRPRADAVVP